MYTKTDSKWISARVSTDEMESLKDRASSLGMSVSSYVRYVCFNASIKSTVG